MWVKVIEIEVPLNFGDHMNKVVGWTSAQQFPHELLCQPVNDKMGLLKA